MRCGGVQRGELGLPSPVTMEFSYLRRGNTAAPKPEMGPGVGDSWLRQGLIKRLPTTADPADLREAR